MTMIVTFRAIFAFAFTVCLVLAALLLPGPSVFRWYENEGKGTNLSVRFLGKALTLELLNLLEKPAGGASGPKVSSCSYEIKTVRAQELP